MAVNIHRTVRFLEENLQAVPEDSRKFVSDMVGKLDQYGDSFYVTPKQSYYLRSLEGRVRKALGVHFEDRPLSRLDELKAKRHKILSGQIRRGRKARNLNAMRAGGVAIVAKDIVDSPIDARMRHQKSRCRQLTANPLLIVATKSD